MTTHNIIVGHHDHRKDQALVNCGKNKCLADEIVAKLMAITDKNLLDKECAHEFKQLQVDYAIDPKLDIGHYDSYSVQSVVVISRRQQ